MTYPKIVGIQDLNIDDQYLLNGARMLVINKYQDEDGDWILQSAYHYRPNKPFESHLVDPSEKFELLKPEPVTYPESKEQSLSNWL